MNGKKSLIFGWNDSTSQRCQFSPSQSVKFNTISLLKPNKLLSEGRQVDSKDFTINNKNGRLRGQLAQLDIKTMWY